MTDRATRKATLHPVAPGVAIRRDSDVMNEVASLQFDDREDKSAYSREELARLLAEHRSDELKTLADAERLLDGRPIRRAVGDDVLSQEAFYARATRMLRVLETRMLTIPSDQMDAVREVADMAVRLGMQLAIIRDRERFLNVLDNQLGKVKPRQKAVGDARINKISRETLALWKCVDRLIAENRTEKEARQIALERGHGSSSDGNRKSYGRWKKIKRLGEHMDTLVMEGRTEDEAAEITHRRGYEKSADKVKLRYQFWKEKK